MASTFYSSSFMLLSVFLVLLTSPLSFARQLSNQFISNLPKPKSQVEMLIRGLNLFPKHAINMLAEEDSLFTDFRIVEKQFSFNLAGDPGPSIEEFGHYAGYFQLPRSNGARMFYFFFESRNSKNDPVVLWLSGGPGCGSGLALFYENGPFKITNNMTLEWNDYGWDKTSNIIYVDQPVGTGFSYKTDDNDIKHNEYGVSNDLYDFLEEFFKAHPDYAKNDFYITGESYAGHYIPAFASRIHQANKNQEGLHINLKGFAIGNALTNPEIQYEAYTDFALENNLIDKSDYHRIGQLIPGCKEEIKACESGNETACATAYSNCSKIFDGILEVAGNINYYDIRKQCEGGDLCYDFSNMETFLGKKEVKDALGVGNLEFVSCSSMVYEAMLNDIMKNLDVAIPALLEDDIEVLIYVGVEDLICNWLGNSRWVHAMEWSGKEEFEAAGTVPFTVDNAEAGKLKSYGPLAFLKIENAGHMVPMDQPKAALQMLQSWMQGKLGRISTSQGFEPM